MSLVVMPFAYMDKIFSSMLIFFGTAILSGHNKNLRWGASILHHIEDLHKVWNGPAESVTLGPNLLSLPCAASVAFPSPLRSLSHYIIFPVIRGLCQQPQVGPRLPHRNRNAPGQHSAIRTHEITLFFLTLLQDLQKQLHWKSLLDAPLIGIYTFFHVLSFE